MQQIRFLLSGFPKLGLYRIMEAAFGAVLGSAGVLWLVIEIGTYFHEKLRDTLQPYYWIFFAVGGAYALIRIGVLSWKEAPRQHVRCKISGTDIWLEIVVGDVFAIPGAIIVPSSVTFDTSLTDKLLHRNSILGQFITRYYNADTHFDQDVQKGLEGITPLRTLPPAEKPAGKRKEYSVGTCVRVNANGNAGYVLGIGRYNQALTTSAEMSDLQNALPLLWEFVRTKGELEHLKMPVIGSGRLRIHATRAELVKEIVRSFVAATQESRFCVGLTIAIHPNDVSHLDFEDLARFVECESCYRRASGTAANNRNVQNALSSNTGVALPVNGSPNEEGPTVNPA